MTKEHGGNSRGDQGAEEVFGFISDKESAVDEDGIEEEDEDSSAEESEFFTDDSKDEVGGIFRDIVEGVLRSIGDTMSIDTAGSDSDNTLSLVITDTEGIFFKVDEAEQSLAVIGFNNEAKEDREEESEGNGKGGASEEGEDFNF